MIFLKSWLARMRYERDEKEARWRDDWLSWQANMKKEQEDKEEKKKAFLNSLTPVAANYLVRMEELRLKEYELKRRHEYRPLFPFTD